MREIDVCRGAYQTSNADSLQHLLQDDAVTLNVATYMAMLADETSMEMHVETLSGGVTSNDEKYTNDWVGEVYVVMEGDGDTKATGTEGTCSSDSIRYLNSSKVPVANAT